MGRNCPKEPSRRYLRRVLSCFQSRLLPFFSSFLLFFSSFSLFFFSSFLLFFFSSFLLFLLFFFSSFLLFFFSFSFLSFFSLSFLFVFSRRHVFLRKGACNERGMFPFLSAKVGRIFFVSLQAKVYVNDSETLLVVFEQVMTNLNWSGHKFAAITVAFSTV